MKSFSVSHSALRNSSYAEDYRIRGYQWVHEDNDVFANGLNCFVIDSTMLEDMDLHSFILPLQLTVPEGPVIVTVYEGTDYVGATDMLVCNSEREDGHTHNVTFKSGATGTDKGTKLYSFSVGHTAVAATVHGCGSDADTGADPITLNRAAKYLIEINNTTGGSLTCDKFYLTWFEVPTAEL